MRERFGIEASGRGSGRARRSGTMAGPGPELETQLRRDRPPDFEVRILDDSDRP